MDGSCAILPVQVGGSSSAGVVLVPPCDALTHSRPWLRGTAANEGSGRGRSQVRGREGGKEPVTKQNGKKNSQEL